MAVYLIQTGSAFTITGAWANCDINVVRGSVRHTSEFHRDEVFADTTEGVSEFRGRYQWFGHIEGFLDTAATTMPATTDFAVGTAASTVTFTLRTGKVFTMPAHIENWEATGDRQGGLAGYSFDFRSDGNITSITDT